jgi:hypothetical protein
MKIKLWVILCIVTIIFTACEIPEESLPTPEPKSLVWIDAPLDGSWLPMKPNKLVFHGASYSGISQFDVQVNGLSVALVTPGSTESGGAQFGTLFMGEYLWTPPAPGTYIITVFAVSGGQSGSSAQAQVIIGNAEEAKEAPAEVPADEPALEVITETPAPAATATVTPTSEPQACMLTALVNLFCRPAPGYEPVDSFTVGQTSEVLAQSAALYSVMGPNNHVKCTVPKDDNYVSVEGDCNNLPEFNPPPPPTATFTSTPTPAPTATPTLALRTLPQCDDGADNDSDGLIDLRDSDCTSASDNDESTP